MARSNDSTTHIISIQTQGTGKKAEHKTLDQSSINPASNNNKKKEKKTSSIPFKAEEPTTTTLMKTTGRQISSQLFLILFYLHLLLITILILYLTFHSLKYHFHHFHPRHWYPPLLTSSACAPIVAFTWLLATLCNPSKAIRAAFCLSPLLTFAAAILLLCIGSAGSLAAAAFVLIFALIQSLYACWVVPRLGYATRVLSASLTAPTSRTTMLIAISMIIGTTYSCFSVSGIGGATATGTRFDALFILVILLSLAWTMQVIRNISHVAISRVGYMYLTQGIEFDSLDAFHDTIKQSMGNISLGSALVPVLGVVRGSARGMSLVAGGTDEFLFSCANCYAGVAAWLVAYGNRWGFVHVGVYNKGFVRASKDTWEMFGRVGLESVIDSDLTGSFSFLCGVAAGAVCTLVGGSWTLAVDKSYATEVSIYAFLIGYFMSRIAMSWPQGCVSAYYVAYAENPQNPRFESTIRDGIQELQRSRA